MPEFVVVTGASSGIGRASARLLARSGFHVFAGVRRDADAAAIRAEELQGLLPLHLDVTDAASIAAARESVEKAVGEDGLAGLVNNAGIGIAGVDLGEVRGSPASSAEFTKFYEAMVARGWSPRPILLGQSRGGLMMLAWAVRNPEKPRAFVGIYPVCSLEQWPMKNLATTLADYRLPEAEFRARMKEFNPLDNLAGLLKHRVPMFVVHGDSDAAVTYDDNTRILKERYETGGGPITVKIVKGEGHQATPAFFECRELIDFVLQNK